MAAGWKVSGTIVVRGLLFKQETGSERCGCCMDKPSKLYIVEGQPVSSTKWIGLETSSSTR